MAEVELMEPPVKAAPDEVLKEQLAGLSSYQKKGSRFSLEILREAVESAVKVQAARFARWGGWYLAGPAADADTPVSLTEQQVMDTIYDYVETDFRVTTTYVEDVKKALGFTFTASGDYLMARLNVAGIKQLLQSKQAAEAMEVPLYNFTGYYDHKHILARGPVVKVRKGQSVSRALLKAVDSVPVGQGDHWSRAMERFGQLWSAQAADLRVYLSCAPADFLGMGMWGESSCYKAGSEQEMSKLVLMNAENAVVLKIMKGGADPTGKPVARAWGFWLEDEGLVLNNLYLMYWEQLSPYIKAAVESWLGHPVKEAGKKIPSEKGIRGPLLKTYGVYSNGDAHGFGDNIKKLLATLQDTKVEWTLSLCPRCRKPVRDADQLECGAGCGTKHCSDCAIDAVTDNGDRVKICRDCANNKPTRRCQGCETQVYFLGKVPKDTGCTRCADWWCPTCRTGNELTKDGLCEPCDTYQKRMEARARGEEGPWDVIEGCECAACVATAGGG